MTYTGDVESFKKLIDEGERHEDGTVTISVPKVEEIIDNEYINKHVFNRGDGVVECQLTWHVFSKEKWFEVFDVLKERNDITRLHLEHGKMDRDVMKKLAENPHITDLLIETMETNEEVAELSAMPSLTSLSLIRFCTEGPLKATALEAFSNSKLTSLTISDMESIEFSGLQKLLLENSTITSLTLKNVAFTEDNYVSLFSSPSLTSLCIYPDDPVPLASLEILSKNTKIENLTLSFSSINEEGMRALAANASITHLDLSYMEVDDNAVLALCENNNTITHLVLKSNPIGDDGAGYLAAKTNLIALNLESTKLTADGVEYFFDNMTLQDIKIKSIPKKAQSKLDKAVARLEKLISNNVYRALELDLSI